MSRLSFVKLTEITIIIQLSIDTYYLLLTVTNTIATILSILALVGSGLVYHYHILPLQLLLPLQVLADVHRLPLTK